MESQGIILVVDDEPEMRDVLDVFLTKRGYRVIQASNGIEALTQARQHLPDLVLLDVMLPQMDGFEVCRHIRKDPMLADMPVIMLSALNDRQSRLWGIEVGADDFISKPYDLFELLTRVSTITNLNRYRRLLSERARFAWVVEQAREGYLLLDTAFVILYLNPAASTMLGITIGEKSEVNFAEWTQKHYTCAPEEAWGRWRAGGQNDEPLFLILPETERTSVTWLQVETINLPFEDKAGRLVRLVDITDRIAMQYEMATFHRIVNHKLRTPVSNMIMASELYYQEARRGKVSSQELAEALWKNTQRLNNEMRDIFSYLDAPLAAMRGDRLKVGGLRPLLGRCSREQQIERGSLKITGSLNPDAEIKMPTHALEMILTELLENARKFHPTNSPFVEIEISCRPSQVVITIRDDGVSLSPEQLQRAWLPYYQVDKGFTGEVAGMGLGLATVAILVWQVGGKARMYNCEGRPGVAVELTLPAESSQK